MNDLESACSVDSKILIVVSDVFDSVCFVLRLMDEEHFV